MNIDLSTGGECRIFVTDELPIPNCNRPVLGIEYYQNSPKYPGETRYFTDEDFVIPGFTGADFKNAFLCGMPAARFQELTAELGNLPKKEEDPSEIGRAILDKYEKDPGAFALELMGESPATEPAPAAEPEESPEDDEQQINIAEAFDSEDPSAAMRAILNIHVSNV